MIPFGQPVLVGHHSEGRHRRDIERIHAAMDRSVEESKKAEYYTDKASAALNNTAISSDHPDAVNLLKKKLADMEATRDQMKKINKKHAEFLKNPETLKASGLTEETQEKIRNYKPRYSWEPHPYPPYELTNLNGNMRRVKERIAELEAKEAMPDVDKVINGVRIVTDKAYNRVRVFFPSIPSEETRGRLKQSARLACTR
jgi:hypothetical protein